MYVIQNYKKVIIMLIKDYNNLNGKSQNYYLVKKQKKPTNPFLKETSNFKQPSKVILYF